MAEPALSQRTPVVGLKFESDDSRNFNWAKLDDTVGRAFTPGSPLQIPPGVLTAVYPAIVPDLVTVANIATGLLYDGTALALQPLTTYWLSLMGDVTRPAAETCTLSVAAGGVALFDHRVGGPLAAAQIESYAITLLLYMQADRTMRIAATCIWAPDPDPTNHVAQGTPTLYVRSVPATGDGLSVAVTWDAVVAANVAHATIAMLQTITNLG
jgi:hypothetical protein